MMSRHLATPGVPRPLAKLRELHTQRDFTKCWPWPGTKDRLGYGRFAYNDPDTKRTRAVSMHRVAYEAFRGPIPVGLELDHLCCNRDCYNPTHLEAVTHAENVRRRDSRTKAVAA